MLHEVFDPGQGADVPALEEIARRHFPDQWPGDNPDRRSNDHETAQAKTRVLEHMLRLAADRLEGGFGSITAQEAALRLFNLDGGTSRPDIEPVVIYGLSGKRYTEIRRHLLKRADPWNKMTRPSDELKTLRQGLARILTDPAFPFRSIAQPVQQAGVLAVRSVVADEYVPRPAYEQEIRELRDAGEPHVWLWGDAGTGKTRLARAANRDRTAERSVRVLAAGDVQALDAQLAELVVSAGVPASTVNPANSRLHFFEQLAKGTLPQVLVFDDAPVETVTGNDLVGALTTARGSFMIFTSIGAPPTTYNGPRIEVRGMTDAESALMIQSRLPDISDRDVVQLHEALGARPLAIEHSCAFLRETGLPVRDYCQALAREPAATLHAAGEQYGRTLTQVYQLVLDQLASSSGSSGATVRALDLLVFSTDLMTIPLLAEVWVDGLELPAAMPQPGELVQDYVRSASLWCGAWPGVRLIDPTRLPKIDPVESVTLRQALRRLEAFALVRSDNGRLVMHELTRAVLRALRDDQADNIYQRIRQTVYDTVRAENWQAGDALSATRLRWAPQLREAFTRALRTISSPTEASADEVIRLATLGAVMMRAHRQMGIDPTPVLRDVAHAGGIALARRQLMRDTDPDVDALWKAYLTLHTELLEFLILVRGFDRSVDSFPHTDAEPTPQQQWLANTIRLKHATEWDLARHYLTPGEQQAREHNTVGYRLAATSDRPQLRHVRASADDAITVATIYYDQARWDAAVDALEHAYECYLQIGASVEAIRGAMDAGRRLARVHLRAGRLDDAGTWLDRVVREVYQPRSENFFEGRPSPFKLVDRLLWAQLEQTRVELELTKTVLEWDQEDDELLPEKVASVAAPWHQRAKRAVARVRELRAMRLIPEFSMHAFRLQVLTGSTEDTTELGRWFEPEKEPYRATLLRLQVATLMTPFIAPILAVTEEEFRSRRQEMSDAEAENSERIRNARDQAGVELVELAQEVGVTYGNPYWHVRGICAAAMMATVAEADPAWAASLRATAKQGARDIGRPDWAEKIDGFGDTNTGYWLIGY